MIAATAALAATLLAAPPPVERVVSVRIVSDRDDDSAKLTRYLDVQAGDPFDPEAVRRSVRNLFATGDLTDVLVERAQAQSGWDLTFRLERVPRLTAIVVEGAGLSPSGVRRVTRLRDGEPLWPRRLEQAAQDAALALVERGHLEARVAANARQSPSGALAVFDLHAGPITSVGTVVVEGLAEPQASDLLARFSPRAGHAFSRQQAQASAGAARRRLRKRGYWSALVEVRETYDPFHSRIDLALDVQAGARTLLAFQGYQPPRARRQDIRRILVESGLRSETLDEAADLLEAHLRRQGHRSASVTYEIVKTPQAQTLVFTSRTGPTSSVASVSLEGSPRVELLRSLETRAGQPFDEERLSRDTQTLTRLLQEDGFAEAGVEAAAPETAGSVPVVFRVRLGPRTLMGSVSVVTPTAPAEAPPAAPGLREGDPFRAVDLARARNALTTTYRDRGHPQVAVAVDSQLSPDRSRADVTFRVDPGPRVEIDRILVAGLVTTKEEVVRRELLVKEGEPFRWDRILESHRRISGLGLFRSVGLYELDPDEPLRRSLVVAVDEGPRTTLAYGLGAAGIGSSVGGSSGGAETNPTLRASAEVTRRNLGGWNRDLSLFARLSFRGSRFLATYREPYLLGRQVNLSATVFREDEERSEFSFERVGGSLEATRPLAPHWDLILRYTVSQTHLGRYTVALEDIDRQYRSARESGPSISIVGDTRDDPLDPRRGAFLSADIQFSHAKLGGRTFLKSYSQASSYFSLSRRAVLALGTRLGAAETPRGQDLDPPDRFYLGGPYSLRGFDTDRVLPEGGRALWQTSVEMRIGIKGRLSTGLFLDAGAVFPTLSKVALNDVRESAGLGLRYGSPIGPIRVDWARNLDRHPGEPRQRLHVTVGHAF